MAQPAAVQKCAFNSLTPGEPGELKQAIQWQSFSYGNNESTKLPPYEGFDRSLV